LERNGDCYREGASDVRAAWRKPASQNHTRRPARATANERPSKGISQPGSLQMERRTEPPPLRCWEASDQQMHSEAPPLTGWRLLRKSLGDQRGGQPAPWVMLQEGFSVKPHLPREGLRCSIRVAYHAADAGHPSVGRASSPRSQSIPSSESVQTKLCCGGSSRR
jgi:hypothetical protein